MQRLVMATLLFLIVGCASVGERAPNPDEGVDWFVWRNQSVQRVAPPPAMMASTWLSRLSEEQMVATPTRVQIATAQPIGAAERAQPGAVILEGRVLEDGRLVWRVLSVSARGWYFEDAAIRVGSLYRAPRQFPDGRSTLGASFVTVIGFTNVLPDPVLFE